ncbi:MAG: cytochrome c biogenesis protein CcsA, partial [Candidatus Kariarchaeaceae archaeon]
SWIAFGLHWKSKSRTKKIINTTIILTLITTLLLWLDYGIMLAAFLRHDYQLLAVYGYSDNNMGFSELVMATWASRQGVMLLWGGLTSTIALFCLIYLKDSYNNIITGRTLTILLFFSALIATFSISSDPFELGFQAEDGIGLPPSLMSYWQQIHPPVAFLAYSAFVFPYASGLSMLTLNNSNVKKSEKIFWLNDFFMILGWGLTSIFMVAGSIWGYEENWAGFWAWDPVEIATLILWLVSSLYFHGKSHVSKDHPLQHTLAALGWVTVTFASFIVRGGMLEGFHNYAGLAKAIVFTLLFLGTTSGLIYALMKVQSPILPEKLINPQLHPKKVNFYTFWIMTITILGNVVGIFAQIVNVLILNQNNIPFAYYILLNGPLFVALLFTLLWSEMKTKLLTQNTKRITFILSVIIASVFMYKILHTTIIGYIITSIIGILVLSLIMISLLKLTKVRNARTVSRQLVHIAMALMIFSYFAVDPNSQRVWEALIPGRTTIVEEFDLEIVAWREVGDGYPTIKLNVSKTDNYLGQITITQGVYQGQFWVRGDWITQNIQDYYFILENMQRIEYDREAPIILQIQHKPLTNSFRLSFYYYVVITFVAAFVKIKNRPKIDTGDS